MTLNKGVMRLTWPCYSSRFAAPRWPGTVAAAGTKGSPTGANGGPFLPTRLSDVAEPFCVRPADQSTNLTL